MHILICCVFLSHGLWEGQCPVLAQADESGWRRSRVFKAVPQAQGRNTSCIQVERHRVTLHHWSARRALLSPLGKGKGLCTGTAAAQQGRAGVMECQLNAWLFSVVHMYSLMSPSSQLSVRHLSPKLQNLRQSCDV